MAQTNCKHFTGYKPCSKSTECDENCPSLEVPSIHVLVVHLEAMGAVLRATSLLKAIRRKYPNCHITWVTKAPSHLFFKNNPRVDRVLTLSQSDLLKLTTMQFEVGYCVDKSLEAIGVMETPAVDMVYGFSTNGKGAIMPATKSAEYLWSLGLNNHEKFFVNKSPETRLMVEALELGDFKRDEYDVVLSSEETKESMDRRKSWIASAEFIIGINTGCAPTIPYKKFSISYHRKLIKKLLNEFDAKIVLLGGPEDTLRNIEIGKGLDVVLSPTESSLRDGLVSMNACDHVISGDSLGMHMAIALKKWVVAWFGPTCSHEIDLYNRGVAVITKAPCTPCWKRSCQNEVMCYELVEFEEIINGVRAGHSWYQKSSSIKPPLSAMPY